MLLHLHPSEQKQRGSEQVVANVQHELLLQLLPSQPVNAAHFDD